MLCQHVRQEVISQNKTGDKKGRFMVKRETYVCRHTLCYAQHMSKMFLVNLIAPQICPSIK